MATKTTWIAEEEAAVIVQRKPRTLRKKVKSGAWDVAFRTIEGRSFQYDVKGLEKLFNERNTA